ncbi:MAG: cadmium resistance transporter [Pseudomonadales bacterium]|nr:cadmium resistance transporter [Pseudomonadales bacterium]MBO6563541.1 cadmium resistance transporter [Pseudomonadales bacterium]MBO6596855.1 cadmium resistance transporter [Pseudomonadales bacterium]MBO6657954.1 cadmium resistance transporter [Pseudomonadales bacterium]MBO6703526.1 cadmium resistance transporter [Pseudomonadales bacterium]
MFTVVILVFATFAATNIDNLLLLISFVVSGAEKKALMLGFMGGMLLILLMSAGLGLVSLVVPVQYLGFLGVIPLMVGLQKIYEMIRKPNKAEAEAAIVSIGSMVTLQLSNGLDTVLVFAPLFADSLTHVDYSIALAFLISAIAWLVLAMTLGQSARRIEAISRYGIWLAPAVMIVLGLYILDNTVTDLVAGS